MMFTEPKPVEPSTPSIFGRVSDDSITTPFTPSTLSISTLDLSKTLSTVEVTSKVIPSVYSSTTTLYPNIPTNTLFTQPEQAEPLTPLSVSSSDLLITTSSTSPLDSSQSPSTLGPTSTKTLELTIPITTTSTQSDPVETLTSSVSVGVYDSPGTTPSILSPLYVSSSESSTTLSSESIITLELDFSTMSSSLVTLPSGPIVSHPVTAQSTIRLIPASTPTTAPHTSPVDVPSSEAITGLGFTDLTAAEEERIEATTKYEPVAITTSTQPVPKTPLVEATTPILELPSSELKGTSEPTATATTPSSQIDSSSSIAPFKSSSVDLSATLPGTAHTTLKPFTQSPTPTSTGGLLWPHSVASSTDSSPPSPSPRGEPSAPVSTKPTMPPDGTE
ncbi:unnamed protein product [Protopolystoma xenopodis]|uniref:Uncharacterized protein n=1 Tax=Protopolystoma xenopodis TaxID=117903 RepID=A0A448WAG3_9PLAT|nr:unnamed protein product [Protopolystoma xenopodis]